MARQRKATSLSSKNENETPKQISHQRVHAVACILVLPLLIGVVTKMYWSGALNPPHVTPDSYTGEYKNFMLPQGIQVDLFSPFPLPPNVDLSFRDEFHVSLQDKAKSVEKEFELLNTFQEVTQNEFLVLSLLKREAILSSQIEGISKTLDVVWRTESQIEKIFTLDAPQFRNITNCVHALQFALQQKGDLSERTLLEIHRILMEDPSGSEKEPGSFRSVEVAVGNPARGLKSLFFPPAHQEVRNLITNLLDYVNNPSADTLPWSVKMAVIHGQFETIHPFRDGNGRVGRILIMKDLQDQGILDKPVVQPSVIFQMRKEEYEIALGSIRTDGIWENWIHFFLDSMLMSCREGRSLLDALNTHYNKHINNLKTTVPPAILTESLDLYDSLYGNPYIKTSTFTNRFGNQGEKVLEMFKQLGILIEENHEYYVFKEVIKLMMRNNFQ